MLPTPLQEELAEAISLIDLARRLARICLDHADLLELARADPDPEARRYLLKIEQRVEAIAPSAFARPDARLGFAHLLDDAELSKALAVARTQSPAEHYAFLCGLCRGHLRRWYEQTSEPVQLLDAMPVPLVSRPINRLRDYRGETTPSLRTLGDESLLAEVDFELYPFPPDEGPPVYLDFSQSGRLDRLTWAATRRDKLPRIGTLHLRMGRDDRTVSGTTRLFDVAPKAWDPDAVLEQLAQLRAAGAQIALLPELALPAPDALEQALAEQPRRYPPLVVAGSAHVRLSGTNDNKEVRANESRTYFHGRLVLVHRKIKPLRTRRLGDTYSSETMVEDLTTEPKQIRVLSGQRTRLAVVICSDLMGRRISQRLEAAGVNLLLVPAMTYGEGSFNGTVTGIASHCQGVTVIANTELEPFTQPDGSLAPPFLVLAGVPRQKPEEQSRSYREDRAPQPRRAVVNPNRRLGDGAVVWLGMEAQAT